MPEWWSPIEDGQQASDCDVTFLGDVVVYDLGVCIFPGRRMRTRLCLRCDEQGGVTAAWTFKSKLEAR